MSRKRQRIRTGNNELIEFYKASKRAFGDQYRATGRYSILVAQNKLEDAVEQNLVSIADASLSLQTPATFAAMLLQEDENFQAKEDRKIQGRMAALERNTDWKTAALVSLGAGAITGLVFAIASPFITTLLQPAADELLKRQPTAPAPIAAPAQPTQQNTITLNSNVYNFYFSAPTPELPKQKQSIHSKHKHSSQHRHISPR